MANSNRDLLVLIKDDAMSEQAIEQEVKKLNTMLMHMETSEFCYKSFEIMDLNESKLTRNAFKVRMMMLKEKQAKPFIFLTNLN